MHRLDLPPSYLSELQALFHAYAPDAEVWAYGSRLKSGSHATSDLDLVVRNPLDPMKEWARLSELRQALSESGLPILVDVLDWASIPESFREEITRTHVVLFPPMTKDSQ